MASDRSHENHLRRGMGVLGNILITLSGITPAVSVFVIASVAFAGQGSGAFLSFFAAAIIGVGMAMSWAELGSMYPIAGGDYSITGHVLGRFMGFLMFVLFLTLAIFIPSAIALGGASYLTPVLPNANPHYIGVAIMVVVTLIAILRIRTNAVLTGIFLMIELLLIGAVVVLGFIHSHNLSLLVHPEIFSSHGVESAASLGAIGAGITIALFSYNGYNSAINLSEETKGRPRDIAKAVYIAFVLAIIFELTPVTAALLGAPSLSKLATSANPFSYLITALAGKSVNTIFSLGVFLAVVNATLAIVLINARIIYSSGRDRAWPGRLSDWMGLVHPRFESPWFATAVIGVIGALLTGLSSIASLVTFTGVIVGVDYGLIAVCAIISRVTQKSEERPYRMPLWPLPPLVGLAGVVYALTQQTAHDMVIVAIIIVCTAAYYFGYLVRRPGEQGWVVHAALDMEVESRDIVGVPGVRTVQEDPA
ncbi:MAG: APC family permease [Acidimicrobiales bacterium]